MERYDVSVRVLYDFQYTTKDGRIITILPGERLLLIKKTNDDWWQVIRSSEKRPFFAPASYVEEINAQSSNKIDDSQIGTCAIESGKNSYVNSLEQIRNSLKPINLNDLPDSGSEVPTTGGHKLQLNNIIPSKNKVVLNTLCSSGYNSLCEEVPVFNEEHLLSLNKHLVDTTILNELKCPSISISNLDSKHSLIVDSQILDKVLSAEEDNQFLNQTLRQQNNTCSKNSINCNIDSGPCRLIAENTNVSSLPASDSLENLASQIELKTSTFINRPSGKCVQLLDSESFKINFEKNLQEQESVLSQDVVDNDEELKDNYDVKHNLKVKLSSSYESVCTKPPSSLHHSSLKYCGSFKTVSEKHRILKMNGNEKHWEILFSCSEDNFNHSGQSKEAAAIRKLPEDIIAVSSLNYVNSTNTQMSTTKVTKKTKKSLHKGELKARYFASDSQLSQIKQITRERRNSHHSLDSVVEGELIGGLEQTKFRSRGYHSLDTNVNLVNSDKSSIDSLLDIENNENYRQISGGTTSDSIVPTDGEDLVSSESEPNLIKLGKSKHDGMISDISKRKPLLRRRRVFASKTRDTSSDPPTQSPKNKPSRSLTDDWCEYNTTDGRKYFYNDQTKERRWKPPRHITSMELQSEPTDNENGIADASEMFVVSVELPTGWQSSLDTASGQTCYINNASGLKWFSSNDGEGRVYFFEENSNQSSWTLPKHDVVDVKDKMLSLKQKTPLNNDQVLMVNPASGKNLSRSLKSKSMFSGNESSSISSSVTSHNWPQLWKGHMAILKEGQLNKTKITENGKRLRKNWTSTHAVLTELLLLFFKDNKGYPAMMSGSGRPELSVDLNGAVIDSGGKVSSRHNVFLLSTVLGLQVLIQSDCTASADDWLLKIQAAIANLPSWSISIKGSRLKAETPPDEAKSSLLVSSKSIKSKQKSASIEDLSNSNVAERQTKIKERLKKFFHLRPSVEMLVKKGIFKDEPVFGCVLEQICPVEPRVPRLVLECIRCIEQFDENMKTDGLYRASGNLSQVQKIRCQVDQHEYGLLDLEEDVHVLTGTLKLFFRELKQPIIPFKFFNRALNASTNQNRSEKIKDFQEIVKSLPPCNYDTLKCLLQHLLRVTQLQEFNRMHIPNIAIVFGPTLMWSEQESQNMACDLMQQNLVIECLLSDFSLLFL